MCRHESGKPEEVLRPREGQEWREKFGENVVVIVGDDPEDPDVVAVRQECGAVATLSREHLVRSYVLL